MLALEDPELEHLFSSGNPAYKDERFEYIKSQLDHYQTQLKQRGVTRKLLWEEYLEEVPSGYGLTQFCFHLNQQLLARNPSMVLAHEPGDKLLLLQEQIKHVVLFLWDSNNIKQYSKRLSLKEKLDQSKVSY